MKPGIKPFDYARVYPALLVFLSVVSWITSAGGLFSWFDLNVSVAIAAGISFSISAFIQIAIAGMWFGVTSRLVSLYIKPVCLALALGLSIVSGGLASGSWMLLTSGGPLQALHDEREFAPLSEPLLDFRTRFDAIAETMRDLSVLSAAKEEEEARAGSSCDGPPVAVGHGPRARLRARLASQANANADLAGTLAEEALTLATLPADATDADFETASAAARALRRDDRLRALRSWIAGTLEGFETGFRDASTADAVFTCRDRKTEALLANAAAGLDALPDFTELRPRATAFTFADSVKTSYALIFATLGLGAGSGDPDWDAQVRDVAWIAFVIAGAIEAIIILLVLLTTAIANAGLVNGAPVGLALRAARREDCRRQVDLLNLLVIEERRGFYFCLPEDGPLNDNGTLRNVARNFVRRWRLRAAPGATAVILSDIAPVAARLLEARGAGATHYSIYPVPRRLRRWWTRAVRDLAVSETAAEPHMSEISNPAADDTVLEMPDRRKDAVRGAD